MPEQRAAKGVAVFSPAPRLTITVERGPDDRDEPHVHVGGQGPWAARMAGIMLGQAPGGDAVQLCLPLGGETGSVVGHLLGTAPVRARIVEVRGDTALYVHDRRGGERHEVAGTAESPLDRHELDDLYNVTLGAALESGVAVLTGTRDPDVVAAEHYARLVTDLRGNEVFVVADLSGDQLRAVAGAGADLIKVSHEELHDAGLAPGTGPGDVEKGITALVDLGAHDLVVTRAAEPAMALIGGVRYDVRTPPLETVEHRGAGDALTGATAAALAQGRDLVDAVRLGAAAGALNVTRHGLATGIRETVEELSARVEMDSRAEAEGPPAAPPRAREGTSR